MEWSTPQDFFDKLNAEFHFTLDVCATAENAKCEKFYSLADDGLAQYGRAIGDWMKKARESSERGATIVCLVPARTCTKWWHQYAARGDVTFLRGRLRFGSADTGAPFPSALIVFSNDKGVKRYIKQCITCDGLFAALRSDAETCGGTCRVRLHRQRRRPNEKRPEISPRPLYLASQ